MPKVNIFYLITSFIFIPLTIWTQEIQGVVINYDNQPVSEVLVVNKTTNDSTYTNAKGEFSINADWDHNLVLFHPRHRSQSVILSSDDFEGRRITIFMEIAEQVQFFEGITVTGERIKSVRDIYNENIIDFIPLINNEILVLTRKVREKQYNVALIGFDTTYFDFDIRLKRPEALFVDCFKNLHIKTKDSVYQFIFTDTIEIVGAMDLFDFERQIAPCVWRSDSSLLYQYFTNHNRDMQLFQLSQYHEPQLIYEITDPKGAKAAQDYFQEIIAKYNMRVSSGENIIQLGLWSGDVMELSIDGELNRMISWYKKFQAKKLHIPCIELWNRVYLFDTENMEVLQFDNKLRLAKKTPLSVNFKPTRLTLLKDEGTGKLYFYDLTSATISIHHYDFDSGTTQEVMQVHELNFPQKIKIVNGWMYFLSSKGFGFYKLYKVKLNEN
ncbi:MAG: carboxypeptidase regulatory-like domain-containing protein [Crocinitomicaceae bacterium]|nr:carboxypeptidase regulatory-like domain-containing protein [Crocinitomicaceae bacterium]